MANLEQGVVLHRQMRYHWRRESQSLPILDEKKQWSRNLHVYSRWTNEKWVEGLADAMSSCQASISWCEECWAAPCCWQVKDKQKVRETVCVVAVAVAVAAVAAVAAAATEEVRTIPIIWKTTNSLRINPCNYCVSFLAFSNRIMEDSEFLCYEMDYPPLLGRKGAGECQFVSHSIILEK